MKDITIYKYSIGWGGGVVPVFLSVGAKVLSTAIVDNDIVIYAEHNPYAETEQRNFQVIGTGFALVSYVNFIGTVIDNIYVWHVFEV